MSRLELEIGDARLDALSRQSYSLRRQGDLQLWQTKLAQAKSVKLENEKPDEVARLKSDMGICQQEIDKITTEVALAEKLDSPGLARQRLRQPSTKLNRNKQVG